MEQYRFNFIFQKYDESSDVNINENNTLQDGSDDKVNFYRNQQIQKQFSEYMFDKDKRKNGEKIIKNNQTKELKRLLSNNGTDKTTKFTTQN